MTAGRRGAPPAGRPGPPASAVRLTRRRDRVLILVLLFVALWALLATASTPSLAVSMYGLVPIVFSAYWFDLPGVLVTASTTTALFVTDKLLAPHPDLAGGVLWLATLNRALVFFGVGILVALLLRRERALALRVRTQQEELTQL